MHIRVLPIVIYSFFRVSWRKITRTFESQRNSCA